MVWQCEPGMARPLRDLTGWLVGHSVTTTKGTGNFRQAPCEALEEAGPQVELFHVQHCGRSGAARPTGTTASGWHGCVGTG